MNKISSSSQYGNNVDEYLKNQRRYLNLINKKSFNNKQELDVLYKKIYKQLNDMIIFRQNNPEPIDTGQYQHLIKLKKLHIKTKNEILDFI